MKKLIVLLLLSNVALANTPPNPSRMIGEGEAQSKSVNSATTQINSTQQVGMIESGSRRAVLLMNEKEPILKVTGLEVEEVKSHFLPKPPRLVFDYFLKKDVFWNTSKRLKSDDFKAMRIGKHPKRIRIVLDLQEGSSLARTKFQTSIGSDAVVLAAKSLNLDGLNSQKLLAREQSIDNEAASIRARALGAGINKTDKTEKSVEAKKSSQKTPNKRQGEHSLSVNPSSNIKDSSLTKTPQVNVNERKALAALQTRDTFPVTNKSLSKNTRKKNLRKESPAAAANKASKVNETRLKEVNEGVKTSRALEQIQFVERRPSMMKTIKLQFNNLDKFELKKVDDRTWVLELKAKLKDAYLSKAFFPPISYKGIYVVQAQQKSDNLSIKIGVEKGYKVSALPKDNAIWVKVDK